MANSFGATAFTSTVSIAGALTANGGITCDTNKFIVADATGDTTVAGDLSVAGDTILGNASTDTITCTGRLVLRQVTDASMASTAGTEAELVYETTNSKVYVCTTTGSPATWAALH